MKFSADGKYILLSSNSSKLICIDSFEGNLTQSYSSTKLVNRNASKLEASFTPDGQYVMSGSEDGKIVMWEALSGKYIGALEGHTNPSACVKFSPTRCLIASACTKVGFWVPDMKMLK